MPMKAWHEPANSVLEEKVHDKMDFCTVSCKMTTKKYEFAKGRTGDDLGTTITRPCRPPLMSAGICKTLT